MTQRSDAGHRLIDPSTVQAFFLREAKWASSHGTAGGHLGAGVLYYAIAYALRANLCVCLGSGGGYVPRLMRQGQIDGGQREKGETWLIDADLQEAGWGKPVCLDEASFFRQEFDVKVEIAKTRDAAAGFQGRSIDYLHIDADHSYEHVAEDFWLWSPLVGAQGIITLHDTNFQYSLCGVPRFVRELADAADPEWAIVNLWWLGTGTAVVVRRPKT